jgi:hypothetical protein
MLNMAVACTYANFGPNLHRGKKCEVFQIKFDIIVKNESHTSDESLICMAAAAHSLMICCSDQRRHEPWQGYCKIEIANFPYVCFK